MGSLVRLLVAGVIGAGLAVGVSAPSEGATVSATPARSWGVNGRVLASVVVGNEVIVGGSFTSAVSPSGTTVPRAHLAAFDATTGALVTGFVANTNDVVRALASRNGTVYAGGQFTSVNSTRRNRVAALDASTGALLAGFSPSVAGGLVRALDVRAGRLFMGGDFSSVAGVSRTRVAAVDAVTGAVDAAFASAPDDVVTSIRSSADGTLVYLGGRFTHVGGSSRTGLAQVSGTNGATTAVTYASAPPLVLGIDLSGDGSLLLVAGGGANNSAAAWRSTTGSRIWTRRTDGDVQAIHFFDGDAYFGFHDGYNGVTATKLLKASAATGALDTSFTPAFRGFWGVFTICDGGGELVAGGEFSRVNSVTASNWARFPITG